MRSMRSASPPRDGMDSGYDGNKRQTFNNAHSLAPQRQHTLFAHTPHFSSVVKHSNLVWRYLPLSLCCATHWTCTQEPIGTELDKLKAGPNSAFTKPTGWRQLMQYFSPFGSYSPSLLLLLFKQHAGDPAGYTRQFHCVYPLAQSAHLHLHAPY